MCHNEQLEPSYNPKEKDNPLIKTYAKADSKANVSFLKYET